MLDAMKAVQDGSPITTAARVHGVPRTSLHNRIKGKVIHGVKSGPKQKIKHPQNLSTLKKSTIWLYGNRMIDPRDEWAPNGIDHDVKQHHNIILSNGLRLSWR